MLDYFGCFVDVKTNVVWRDVLGSFLSRFWKHLLLFRVKCLKDHSKEVILIKSVMGSLCSGGCGRGVCVSLGVN